LPTKHLNSEYDKIFQRYDASSCFLRANEYIDIPDRKQARNYLAKAMTTAPLYQSIFSVIFIVVMIKPYFPWSLSFLASVATHISCKIRIEILNSKRYFPESHQLSIRNSMNMRVSYTWN